MAGLAATGARRTTVVTLASVAMVASLENAETIEMAPMAVGAGLNRKMSTNSAVYVAVACQNMPFEQ